MRQITLNLTPQKNGQFPFSGLIFTVKMGMRPIRSYGQIIKAKKLETIAAS